MTIKMTISSTSTLDLAKAIFSCKGICEYMLKRKVQGHICCPVCERSVQGVLGVAFVTSGNLVIYLLLLTQVISHRYSAPTWQPGDKRAMFNHNGV